MKSNFFESDGPSLQTPSNFYLNSSPFSFTSHQIFLFNIFNNITVGLSFLALLTFFLCTFASEAPTTFSFKLICHLFFANLLYTSANLLSNFSVHSGTLCQIEGFLRTFALWSSVLWVTIIAYTAYYSFRNNYSIQLKYWKFIAIAYGWPCLISIVPLIPYLPFSYGSNEIYCWITTQTNNIVLIKWTIFYFWIWMAIFTTTGFYIRLFMYLRRMNINTRVFEYRVLLIYPIILYITLLPASIDSTGWLSGHEFAVMTVHLFSLHLLGLLNVLAYGIQRIKAMKRRISVDCSLERKLLSPGGFPRRTGPETRQLDTWEMLEDGSSKQSKRSCSSKEQNETLQIVLGESC